jgi:hypothetical protein
MATTENPRTRNARPRSPGRLRWGWIATCAIAIPADAATYQVGPGRPFATLQAALNGVDLGPGDVVEVEPDSDGVYDVGTPGIVMGDTDSGVAGNPVILRGIRVMGLRPHLRGGTNTIEFRSANHVVFEGFEVSGTGNTTTGTFRCVYHHSHDLVIRDAYIRDCPRHGILGADQDSGSLTVEYSEVFNAGSNQGNHAVYMATDEVAYPGAVFRLQYSYLHDSQFGTGEGGNLIKSRAERNEIYYNWLEDAYFHELELIGPDPAGAQAGWSDGLAREDSDVVGNVIVHTADFGSVLRFGGDATSGGRGESFGRYRVVNNTIVRRNANNDTPTVFRLFEGIESLEFHNNVIWREGGSSLTLVRGVEAQWSTGVARVTGSNNWIKTGFAFNPSNLPNTLTGTITGATPGFADLTTYNLAPGPGSPLLNAGTTTTVTPPDYDFPNTLFPPVRVPPVRMAIAPGTAVTRIPNGIIDLGAFEQVDLGVLLRDGFEDP